jgi:hypothetical protein
MAVCYREVGPDRSSKWWYSKGQLRGLHVCGTCKKVFECNTQNGDKKSCHCLQDYSQCPCHDCKNCDELFPEVFYCSMACKGAHLDFHKESEDEEDIQPTPVLSRESSWLEDDPIPPKPKLNRELTIPTSPGAGPP